MSNEQPRKRGPSPRETDPYPSPQVDIIKASPELLAEQKRAHRVGGWYADRGFAALRALGLASSELAVAFLRPIASSRRLSVVVRRSSGQIEFANLRDCLRSFTGFGTANDDSYGLCFVDMVDLPSLTDPQASDVKAEFAEGDLSSVSYLEDLQAINATLVQSSIRLIVAANELLLSVTRAATRRSYGVTLMPGFVSVPASEIPSCFEAVAALMRQKPARAQLVISLTRVPKTWFLKVVREQKKHEIATLVSEVLTPHESAENPVSFPERQSITLVHELWQCVRAEVKPRLEALIESLSRKTFETFEEKAEVSARLNELLDEWRFRAISPTTGRTAYFQCRVGPRNPKGYFFFQDINAQSQPVAVGNPDGPKAPGQIPIFKLTDAPAHPNLRPPDHKPTPRKKRNQTD